MRLLPVGERAHQLFGADGAEAVAAELERSPLKARDLQLGLFAQQPVIHSAGPRRPAHSIADEELATSLRSTTLDRLHAALLLQKTGRTNALRALLAAEQERGPAFLRLANALSGLYPKHSEENVWLTQCCWHTPNEYRVAEMRPPFIAFGNSPPAQAAQLC